MWRILKLAAASVAAVLILGALIIAYLVRFQGLRIERDGSGIKPILSFYKPEEHLAAIRANRAPALPQPAPEIAIAAKEPEPVPTSLAKPYWTDFRGPDRDGRYDQMPILTKWPSNGPPRLWRKPIGGGYASFVFGNGRAFTIEQRGSQEVVSAYNVADGREVWSSASDAFFRESMGGDGPRATPTWDDGRVYALGAEGELKCLDGETGRLLWSKNILAENGAQNLRWAMAASPLIVDNAVIVLPGGPDNKSVVAYDKMTGNPLWHALDDNAAYTSPMLVTLAGVKQLLIVTGKRAVGLSTDGKLLWEYPWSPQYEINAAQPILLDAYRFVISAGYGHGAALVRIARSGDTFTATTVWQNTRMKNKFTSSVLHGGHIYGLDEAILACINAETGELKWKGGRYGYGQVIIAGDQLIVTTEDGDVAVVRATPERHDEVVRFSAIEGKTWNHPAIDNGILLVRNGAEMSAFQLSAR
jgi:outer membrane protein assembly factor BamB